MLRPSCVIATAVHDDPDSLGRNLLAAVEADADSTTLDRLTDALRAPGLQGMLIQALYAKLGRATSRYHGFNHLSNAAIETMLGADPWHWHRAWMGAALPPACKGKLAADLLLAGAGAAEIRELGFRGQFPPAVAQIALGRRLIREGRTTEGLAQFRCAASEDASTGPVIRHAGDDAYRTGDGVAANEWYHLSLHADDSVAFDLTVRETRGRGAPKVVRCVTDCYGVDYSKVGQHFVASPASIGVAVHSLITFLKAKMARHVPPALLIWLRNKVPSKWILQLRTWIYVLADLVNGVARTLRTSGRRGRKPYRGKGRNLLELNRRMKAPARIP